MARLLIVLLFLICFWSKAQDRLQRLIVSEYKINDGSYTYLISYNFQNGMFVSKDTILEGATSDIGVDGYILKSKHILTARGVLVDYKTKKILWQKNNYEEALIEDHGDKLIFENGYKEKYYTLDLKTLIYTPISKEAYTRSNKARQTNRALYFSPNGQQAIYTAYLNKIEIRDKYFVVKKIIPDVSGPIIMNLELSRIGAMWLDDDNFLYDNHIHHKDHHRHTVEIHHYTLSTQKDVLLHQIDSVRITLLPQGVFSKDFKNQLHYRATDGKKYLVNLQPQSINRDPAFYLNQDFSYRDSWSGDTLNGKAIAFKRQDIGTYWALDPKASKDALALEYGERGSNLGYPKGIKIWTKAENRWLTFDPGWQRAILGWIEE